MDHLQGKPGVRRTNGQCEYIYGTVLFFVLAFRLDYSILFNMLFVSIIRLFYVLFSKVEKFLDNPGDKDVTVNKVFTPEMFEKLEQRMAAVGWKSVKSYWENDFSKRTIVEGFMKDETLGSKRLASMPDRITNTINTADGKTVFRPTVINMVRISIVALLLCRDIRITHSRSARTLHTIFLS